MAAIQRLGAYTMDNKKQLAADFIQQSHYIGLIDPYLQRISFATSQERDELIESIKTSKNILELQKLQELKELDDDADLYVASEKKSWFKDLIIKRIKQWAEDLAQCQETKDTPKNIIFSKNVPTRPTFTKKQLKLLHAFNQEGDVNENIEYGVINYTIGPDEIPIYIGAARRTLRISKYLKAKTKNDNQAEAIKQDYLDFMQRHFKYEAKVSTSMLNEESIIDSIADLYGNIMIMFYGSNITMQQFKSYNIRLQQFILCDPGELMNAAINLDRKSFDQYVSAKRLLEDFDLAQPRDKFKCFVQSMEAAAKTLIMQLLQKPALDFTNRNIKEQLQNIIKAFDEVIIPNELTSDILSKYDLETIKTMTHVDKASVQTKSSLSV